MSDNEENEELLNAYTENNNKIVDLKRFRRAGAVTTIIALGTGALAVGLVMGGVTLYKSGKLKELMMNRADLANRLFPKSSGGPGSSEELNME